mmetsp:Transcript_111392/g.314521  ORF Transcript_111392/g.314521 Transcript_111392/m.314521 type:complete len:449 (-) Transcript_111392:50-1396(-)
MAHSCPELVANDNNPLPDLTQRLHEQGVYEQYYVYRQNYLAWRQGHTAGAKGELSARGFARSRDDADFELWYPTASVYQFRHTVGYWVGVLCFQGAVLFTFNAACNLFRWRGRPELSTWPDFVGSLLFLVGCYFMYLQLINIAQEKDEPKRYFFGDWPRIRARTEKASVVGALAYFIGCIFFQISCTVDLWENVGDQPFWVVIALNRCPAMIGCILFVVGGACEMVHNKVFSSWSAVRETVWWVAVFDFFGGVLFLTAIAPGVVTPSWATGETWVTWNASNNFVGSAFFAIAAMLQLVMWESNAFGFALFRQLNVFATRGTRIGVVQDGSRIGLRVDRGSAPEAGDAEAQRFSGRGLVFIAIYCVFASTAMVLCFLKRRTFADSLDIGVEFVIVVTSQTVLLLHSVVVKLPKEQPYRCAVVLCRVACTLGAAFNMVRITFYLVDGPYL